jgi:hypothetical protein
MISSLSPFATLSTQLPVIFPVSETLRNFPYAHEVHIVAELSLFKQVSHDESQTDV